MGNLQNEKVVLFLVIIVATLSIALGRILYWKLPLFDGHTRNLSTVVMVENTPMVDGVLPAPAGFPQDIFLESGEIVESATTYYPSQNATQLSVSYLSSGTIEGKYNEYRNYMQQAGYNLTEGGTGTQIRTLSGTKNSNSLSVIIKNEGNKTIIELSYLSK